MKQLILLIAVLSVAACATAPSDAPPAATDTMASTETVAPPPPPPDPEAFRATAPTPASPRPYQFPAVTRFTLSNGMRVAIAENHNAPLVTIRAVVRSGADHDPAKHSGLAAYTADMLDEGAAGKSAIRLAEEVGSLGADLSTNAEWDASTVNFNVLSTHLERGLDIVADVVMRPDFAPKELDRVKKQRLASIIQQRDQAAVVANDRFSEFVFGGTPYGRSIIGTETSLRRATASDVRSFYRRHYVPNNISFIVTGDIDPATVRSLIEREFGSWKRGADVAPVTVTAKPIDGTRVFLVDRPQAVQSEIRVGHIGVPRATEDYFPLITMNGVLGGVFGSRINLNLRERRGFTYGARSAFAFRRQPGPFVVSAPVRNEVTAASVTEILNELRRIRSGDLTDAELNDAKNYLMGVFPNTVQTSVDLANRITEMELYGLPADYFSRYRERIAAVTKDDVLRVANKYVSPDQVAVVIVGKAGEVEPQLADLKIPIALFDIEGRPVVK